LNQRRTRDLRFYFEYEYSADTKDQIEDLLTMYSSADDIMTHAIAALHEKHFGSSTSKTPPPTYSKTFSGNSEIADKRIDELWHFVQTIKENLQTTQQIAQPQPQPQPQQVQVNDQQIKFTKEANEKIFEKIDELGMKFQKIVREADKSTGQKAVTAEMSKEEVLQLIHRIDKLESKLTRAISETRAAAAPPSRTGRREIRDFGDAPKIKVSDAADGVPQEPTERPLLEDVLDTIIVSVEKDEE
jgi:hypothetical protein